jgi:serine phosphatase RsbU (regulator of sigma subunit)
VARVLKPVAERAGITIDLSGLGNPPIADLDRTQIHNALYSLVNNAIAETPQDGTIFIRTGRLIDETGEELLEIQVADTGRGMPEHVLQRLFTQQAVSRKPGGKGLGTLIVKNAVASHQGTVTVESREGAGTTFCLRLPLQQRDDEARKQQTRRQHEANITDLLQRQQRQEAERDQQARLQQELAIGRRIQMSLLAPRQLRLTGFEVLSRSEPATEVGGDFYDHFQLQTSSGAPRLGIVLGDVAGKGVGAAMFMAVTTTLIQAQAQLLSWPAATLAATNTALYPKMHPAGGQPLFATAVYGLLDPLQREIRVANAGQTPPIYWPAGGDPRYVRVKGLPLGAMAHTSYREVKLHLAPGDWLLLCSDGFIEERDAAGEVKGYAGFLRQLQQIGQRSGPKLIATLFADEQRQGAWRDESAAPDDRTVVLVVGTAPPSA